MLFINLQFVLTVTVEITIHDQVLHKGFLFPPQHFRRLPDAGQGVSVHQGIEVVRLGPEFGYLLFISFQFLHASGGVS